MELKIISIEGKEVGKCKLPIQFSEAIRPRLITRAVEALQSHLRQNYGADPRAGKKASANLRMASYSISICLMHGKRGYGKILLLRIHFSCGSG